MPEGPPRRPRVAVVGGGISGLAAAWFLRHDLGDGVEIAVLESSPRVGGKLATEELAGLSVDSGAESLLHRRPEAVDLARAVGLGDDVVAPASAGAWLWTRRGLRALPPRTVLGVPADLRALGASGALSPAGLARARLDRLLPGAPPRGDVAVGDLVARRLGREVVDRLVEPLLGAVYAGRADRLSLRATMPTLATYVARERTLVAAARRALPPATPGEPVFAGLRGGVGRLPDAVAAASRADVRTGVTVRRLERTADRAWRLVCGPVPAPEVIEADAVLVAVPAAPAARLLAAAAPAASAELATIEYASVAVVALAFPATALTSPLRGTGFLVPPAEGRLVKAVTFSSAKWGWLHDADPGLVVLRASVGRHGEERDLQRADSDIVHGVVDDLAEAIGVVGRPVDARVVRWGGGLPQYAVGHLDRVARVRAAVTGVRGLAVCGAALDGVGVPACVAGAREAATRLVRELAAGATIGS
ncbi:MAG TPA: protoporphyrinogen oxidase [Jiangellales bacterium]|nr:protoporphyrinogen oxidase [Jiangellales bacterium]